MWRRAAAKLLSLRSVTSSPWSAAKPEHAVMKSVAGPKPVVATPTWTSPLSFSPGPASKERQKKTGYDIYDLVGGDILDYDFVNGVRFGTKENPVVMRSLYVAQTAGCCGPDGVVHDTKFLMLHTGEISVCPICSQHFTLECVGRGGYPHND